MSGINLKTVIAASVATLFMSLTGIANAAVQDPLHIAGDYKCTGYDSHDGSFNGDLTFTLDDQASHFEKSFGAYTFKLIVELGGEKATYSGYAAAQGQILSMFFANDSVEAPTDRGTGIAVITHDQDSAGKYTTTLHKSYYLPGYKGGGRGTESCIKTSTQP